MGHDPGAKVKTSRLPPGGRRPGLLGLVVGYGSNLIEGGVFPGVGYSNLRRVMDEQRQWGVILFGPAARLESCSQNRPVLYRL